MDLKAAREAAGYSCADVASACGTSEGAVRKWEKGGGIVLTHARAALPYYGFDSLEEFAQAHDRTVELSKKTLTAAN